MFKLCSRCKAVKLTGEFSIKLDKRDGVSRFNSVCKMCAAALRREYYKKIKHNEDFIIKNRDRVKRYRLENIDVVREKDQARRQTESAKENRKKYIERNRAKIQAQEKIVKRRYHEKNRDQLTDMYVVQKIIQKTTLSANEVPPALIKLKRLHIACKRSLKLKIK